MKLICLVFYVMFHSYRIGWYTAVSCRCVGYPLALLGTYITCSWLEGYSINKHLIYGSAMVLAMSWYLVEMHCGCKVRTWKIMATEKHHSKAATSRLCHRFGAHNTVIDISTNCCVFASHIFMSGSARPLYEQFAVTRQCSSSIFQGF